MNAIATVPAPNDPDVLQLLAINNLRGPAELLPYKDMGYDSQWCHISAKHCALNSGGRRVHGWALWRWDVPQATTPQRLKMNMRGGFGGGKSSDWSRRI